MSKVFRLIELRKKLRALRSYAITVGSDHYTLADICNIIDVVESDIIQILRN